MTKIQLRRDTAANWSTNNPVPSAGEPCFETDTGKLKIGNGSTKYNDLAYQGGGGSTPDNMVTTDTAQTITGLKTFKPSDTASYGVKTGLVVGSMRLGTDTSSSPNPVISGENIKIVNSSGNNIATFSNTESISFGNNSSSMTLHGLANTVNFKAGSSINYVGNLQIGTKTLKYTSATGDTTDLLAGGTSDSLVKSVDSNFSVSDSGQLSLANTLSISSSVTAGTLSASLQVGTPAIRFGVYAGAPVRPEITYNLTDGMKIDARAITSTGNIMRPVTVIASEFKSGDNTTQYEVVNKSPDSNTYMAHMAMPSDKYIDLTLGASGATYTAPADGYFILTGALPSSSDIGHVTLINRLNTTSGTDGKFTVRCYGAGATSVGTGLYASVPAKTGDNVVATWAGAATATILRFIYAVGSEPSS